MSNWGTNRAFSSVVGGNIHPARNDGNNLMIKFHLTFSDNGEYMETIHLTEIKVNGVKQQE